MTKIKIIDDPTPFVIDVLRMELEQKLPYWLSKGLREDAEPVNHTGAGIATFDPLLARRKRRERFFKRKPVSEADVESLPMSGGPGEADMNSVVPRKKFRIRHGKSLKEAYNPNEPREAKGTPHGGRWTKGGLSVDDVHAGEWTGGWKAAGEAYHGTLEKNLKSILKSGIKPRRMAPYSPKVFIAPDMETAILFAGSKNGEGRVLLKIVVPKAFRDKFVNYSFSSTTMSAMQGNVYIRPEWIKAWVPLKQGSLELGGEWHAIGPGVSVGDEMWSPDPEPRFVEFPPIKMGEEDQTISKETIDKLHLTEDDLKARRRVLTQGNEDKSEHLIAFDDVGWENLTSNALTHVSLPDTLVEILRNSVARYTMVHNHPWDSSLSGGDLNIAALPGVKRMFAHVATGSIYSVEQTQLLRDVIKYSPKKYQNLWDAMGISARTINEILSPFNPEFNLGMVSIYQDNFIKNANELVKLRKYWNRISSHLNCLLLNDAGVFNYQYYMDPKMEAFYAPLIKKARESKDWKISSNMIYHEMLEEVNKHKPDNDPFDNLKLYKHTINDES